MSQKAVLDAEFKGLRKGLNAYKDMDPVELDSKQKETQKLKNEAERYTNEIEATESYFRKTHDREAVQELRMAFYVEELDEENGVLRALA